MKKILIALALFSSLSVSANQDAEVLGVTFGSTCEETVQKLNKDYGTPKSQSADKLVYLNEMFEAFKADRIELGFQDLQGTTKLNQARFYFVCPSKAAAIAKMKSLAKKMETHYSVSYDEVEYAKQLGLKVLVTDHHNVTDIIADCLVINPKQPGCEYPFKSLAGCGVAFKMAQALQKKTGMPKSVLTEVLDLAAIGTVGDIMPLVDENRTIVKFGLKVIHLGKRNGLKTLLNAVSLKTEKVNSESISFVIVPHLIIHNCQFPLCHNIYKFLLADQELGQQEYLPFRYQVPAISPSWYH